MEEKKIQGKIGGRRTKKKKRKRIDKKWRKVEEMRIRKEKQAEKK